MDQKSAPATDHRWGEVMTNTVISVANMKGGVGKTTIAVGLAHTLAQTPSDTGGKRVLVVDLDAQANASFWLCGDASLTELIESGRTLDAYLEDAVVFNQEKALKDYLHAVPCKGPGTVSVIACSPELRLVEREMIFFLSERRGNLKQVEKTVSDLFTAELAKLKNAFDIILFDTAPGISALTEAALRASDIVVVPTIPDFISNLGLEAFCQTVWWANRDNLEAHRAPWVIANRVKDHAHHASMLAEMRAEAGAEDAGFRMFEIEIPYSPAIEAAAGAGRDQGGEINALFDEHSSRLFRAFAGEVLQRVGAMH
jgi:cellulose biosynthesis protein BcsQ